MRRDRPAKSTISKVEAPLDARPTPKLWGKDGKKERKKEKRNERQKEKTVRNVRRTHTHKFYTQTIRTKQNKVSCGAKFHSPEGSVPVMPLFEEKRAVQVLVG